MWSLPAHEARRPEQIQDNFPSLTLAQVYGAIAYYLEHQMELDVRFADDQQRLDEMHAENYAARKDFLDAMHARFEVGRGRRQVDAVEMQEASRE